MKKAKKNPVESLQEKLEQLIESDSPSVTVARYVLAITACTGLLFVGPALPGIFKAIRFFQYSERFSERQIRTAIQNLKRRKLIKIVEEKNGRFRVELTMDGKKRVKEFSFDALKIKQPKKWDGKWHVLIFDIPTSKVYNSARDALRLKIKQLGLFQLQRSVWVHPFPCEEEILFVAENYKVEKYIDILTVEKLLHENVLRAKFARLLY